MPLMGIVSILGELPCPETETSQNIADNVLNAGVMRDREREREREKEKEREHKLIHSTIIIANATNLHYFNSM